MCFLQRNLNAPLAGNEAERTAVKRFTAGHGLAYPQLIEHLKLSKFYGVEGLPTVVVIDSQGNVADIFVGGGKEREERLFELVGKLLKADAKKKGSNEGK